MPKNMARRRKFARGTPSQYLFSSSVSLFCSPVPLHCALLVFLPPSFSLFPVPSTLSLVPPPLPPPPHSFAMATMAVWNVPVLSNRQSRWSILIAANCTRAEGCLSILDCKINLYLVTVRVTKVKCKCLWSLDTHSYQSNSTDMC